MSCLTGKLACFSSKKMCVGMGMCVQASFDSLECLSHIFSLAAVLWHQETCVCPDWPSSFWLLGPKLGLVSFCFYWAGWWATLHYGSVQVVVVAVRMGWWCHGQRLPVSRSPTKRHLQALHFFLPPVSAAGGHNRPIQHLRGLFRGQYLTP